MLHDHSAHVMVLTITSNFFINLCNLPKGVLRANILCKFVLRKKKKHENSQNYTCHEQKANSIKAKKRKS